MHGDRPFSDPGGVGNRTDPTDFELVDALNAIFPNVPFTSWSLYPNVLY
jgi:hypothetical protein